MKTFLLFLSIAVANYSQSQVHTAMPSDANTFFDKAMPLIKPSLKNLITQAATVLKNRRANADSLFTALHNNPLLKSMSDENIAGVTTLIIVQASKDADEDLKKMVLSMRDNNNASRISNATQSPEEINEKKQMALQLILTRKSNMAEEINFVLQKLSDQENIISSLK